MLEILFLIAACGGIAGVAKRRDARGWPFVVAAVAGAVLGSMATALLFGGGPAILVRWAWIGLCYPSVFVPTGDGRRLEDSWQCPECRFFHEPTTLVCPCGYRPP